MIIHHLMYRSEQVGRGVIKEKGRKRGNEVKILFLLFSTLTLSPSLHIYFANEKNRLLSTKSLH